MKKAIYYSKKMNKYYFCEKTVFGDFRAITVYGVEKLDPSTIEIKTDKNGKKYFLGIVLKTLSEKGFPYCVCQAAVKEEEQKEHNFESQPTE